MANPRLFWSRKGSVACEGHAPAVGSERWNDEGWQEIPSDSRRKVRYQCERCAARAIQHQTRSGWTPLVLNVDDRPEQLYSRDSILRYHGFTVANSDSWQAALVVARQLRPDLIVLTVRLRELLDQVRADAKLAHIPVVVIADGDEGAADEVAALQGRRVDAFLAGPVAPEALAASLKRLLGTT